MTPDRMDEPLVAADAAAQGELEARLLGFGAAALDDLDCLTLLCGASEVVAAALLAAFGSLPEVLGAPAPELARIAGAAAAARVRLAQTVAERMLRRPLKRRAVLGAQSAVSDYLRIALAGRPREQFRVLFLDKRLRLIADEVLGEGTVDQAAVYPREVVRRALELNAAGLILAHNHPAQDPNPSVADLQITAEVVSAARALSIAVHDHLIVAGEAVTSLRARGLL